MDKVIDFNQEILKIDPRVIGLQDAHEAALSYTQLIEEAREFQEAYGERDFIGCIDAVLDTLYFSYGILYKMGLSEALVNELFDAVHTANITKKKGVKQGREGFDAADATKPIDWRDPKHVIKEVLKRELNSSRGS